MRYSKNSTARRFQWDALPASNQSMLKIYQYITVVLLDINITTTFRIPLSSSLDLITYQWQNKKWFPVHSVIVVYYNVFIKEILSILYIYIFSFAYLILSSVIKYLTIDGKLLKGSENALNVC